MSPLQGLVPGVALLVLLSIGVVLTLIETVIYFSYIRWYYRLGASLHREEWQAAVPIEKLMDALRLAAQRSSLPVRFRGDCICARRPWWAFSAWPRFTLTAVAHGETSILVYQARPFLSMVAMAVCMLIGFLSGFIIVLSIIGILCVVVTYVLCWRYELREVNRFYPILVALRDCGIHVCEACGYDLYMRPAEAVCPECGCAPKNAVPLSNGPVGKLS